MDRYHYIECGLDGVWLLNGFEHIDTGYGKAVHIENVEGLHRVLGEHVARLDRSLVGAEVRFLREAMDLSQHELGKLLGLSDGQQVMKVEAGKHGLCAPADQALRALYLEHAHSEVRLEVRRRLSALRDAAVSNGVEPAESAPLELEASEHAWRTLPADRNGRHA